MTNSISSAPVSRRTVLAGVAAIGAAGALAACGTSGGSNTATTGGPITVSTSEVPVGGGKVVADAGVVVTQPSSGVFKAFSAVCTHQGCTVGAVENGSIICPCHGSHFSATDGSVQQGPATAPLPSKTATVSGTNISVS